MSGAKQQEGIVETPVTDDNRIKTLNRLKGSRVAIESFLERYAESHVTRIESLEGVEWLDRIVGEAALGNFDSAEVERWMSHHRDLAHSPTLSEQDRKRISSLLLELQSHSDTDSDVNTIPSADLESKDSSPLETDGAAELRRRFATWKERSGSVNANLESIIPKGLSSEPQQIATDAAGLRSAAVENVDSAGAAHRSAPRKIVLRRKGESGDIGLFERFTEQVWTELDLLYQEFETGEHALTKLDQLLRYAETKTDPMYLHLAGSLIYFLKIEGFRMAPYAERLRKAEKRFSGRTKSAANQQ